MHVVGDGFVAGHLRARLSEHHHRVTAIAAGVSSTSVRDPAAFTRETDLVHRVLARAADRGHRVVFFSSASSAVYGAPGCPGTEDGRVTPTNPYGRHKLALESAVRTSPVPTVVLRVSHLVGPDQRGHQLLPGLAGQILGGSVRVVDGAHRDLLDVADLATILGGALALPGPDVLLNACSGVPQPIGAVVDGIEARLGVRAARESVDGGAAGAMRVAASTERLRALVPAVAGLGFDDGYLDRLLDRHLPAVAASLGTAVVPA